MGAPLVVLPMNENNFHVVTSKKSRLNWEGVTPSAFLNALVNTR